MEITRHDAIEHDLKILKSFPAPRESLEALIKERIAL